MSSSTSTLNEEVDEAVPGPSTDRSARPLAKKSRKSTGPRKRPSNTEYNIGNKVFKVSEKILQEIRHLQMSSKLVIPRAAFVRLVREILMQHCPPDWRIQRMALEALQEATEMFLTQLFEDSNRVCTHTGRITLKHTDVQLVMQLVHGTLL